MNHRRRQRSYSAPRRLTFESLEPLEMLADGTATIEITAVPSVVQPNELVDISVRYRLTGNSKSGPWEVKEISLYDNDVLADDRIATTSGSISRQSTWQSHTFRNVDLSDFDDGGNGVELYAKIVIDDNAFNFMDAVGTSAERQISVGQPDLQIQALEVSRAAVLVGDDVEIDAVVLNRGNASAARSTVRYYFGPTRGSRDIFIGEGIVPNLGVLSPGESSTDSPTGFPQPNFTIPNVASGTYFITAVADALGAIGESDEGNNERSFELNVMVGQADLRVIALTASDTTVAVGDEIEIDAVVRNDGNRDAPRSHVRYYFGASAGSRDTFIGEGIVPNLGVLSPGESSTDSPTGFPQPNFTIPMVASGTYFITAVADALGAIDESDEGNNERSLQLTVGNISEPAFTRLTCAQPSGPGVTIITHGFQLFSGSDAKTPDWTIEMAEAVADRSQSTGSIFVHDPVTSSWVTPETRGLPEEAWDGREPRTNSNNVDEEIILVFDWTNESDDLEEGWLEAAADSLFANLVAPFESLGGRLNLLTRPLHFIGHSRGTVVNTLVANRLAYQFPGLAISQFTTLDPHPSTVHRDPGSEARLLQIPDTILWADNYYREDGSYETDLDFNGVPVAAARNLKLNEDVLNRAGSLTEHSDVHLWYLATIKDEALEVEGSTMADKGFQDWWQSGVAFDADLEPESGRDNVGFARSRLGGSPLLVDQMDRERLQTPDSPSTVFNGDFELGDELFDEIPAWERHGGGGSGNLNRSDANNYLQLSSFGASRRHNEMYVPPSASNLTFDYWINDGDTLNSNDVLQVLFGADLIDTISLAAETNGFVSRSVSLPTDQAGTVRGLEFRIGGPGGIDSAVRIDNVAWDGVQPGPGPAELMNLVHAAIIEASKDLTFDLNRDGRVDVLDGRLFVSDCQGTREGDADMNREVDFADFLALAQNFGKSTATWTDGDFNYDQKVSFADFLLLAENIGNASSSIARLERVVLG